MTLQEIKLILEAIWRDKRCYHPGHVSGWRLIAWEGDPYELVNTRNKRYPIPRSKWRKPPWRVNKSRAKAWIERELARSIRQ